MKFFLRFITAGVSIFLSSAFAGAQVKDSLLVKAGKYIEQYDYEQALKCYDQAEYYVADSLGLSEIEAHRSHCDTLLSLSTTIAAPVVISRARFSKKDFFLYYPFPDGAFRPVEGGGVVFYPGTEDHIFISRDEAEGQFLSITIGDNKYFSKESPDGFGGYDLYCSEWDSELGEWKEAKNLGFPYSSSANDYLFVDTEDGHFSLFASDRSCSADSVYVYVIDKTKLNTSAQFNNAESRLQLAELIPNVGNDMLVRTPERTENPWTDKYQEVIAREKELNALLETAPEEQKASIREELGKLAEEKREIEEYIFESNSQTRTISGEVDRDVAGVEGSFIFYKRKLGAPIKVTLTQD